jgi:hypothetical protein
MTLTLLPGGPNRDPTADAFRAQVERIKRNAQASQPQGTPSYEPSGYEMVTRQMVEAISEDVRDIKSKLTNLIFVLAGAVMIDIVSRVLGA